MTAQRVIHFTVNGEQQTTDTEFPTLEEILRKAGAVAGIDEKDLGSYFLESLDDGRKYEDLSDKVEVKEGSQFVAIHVGKTPVA